MLPEKARRIQSRLVLLLLFILVPVLAIYAYGSHETTKRQRARELQASIEMGRAVARAFETFVQDLLHQEAAIMIALTPPQPISPEEQSRILTKNREVYTLIQGFDWVNPEGFVAASSAPESVGLHLSDRVDTRKIIAGQSWAVSDLMIKQGESQPFFTVSRGFRNEKGELLGIVVANVLPDLLDPVLKIVRSEGAGISLVDSKGMLVYRFPHIHPTWEERDWLKPAPNIQIALDGGEIAWTDKPQYQDDIRIMSSVPVSSIGWSAGAGRRENVAMAEFTSVSRTQAAFFLLVALAAFGAALLFSRPIVLSIRKLRDHALALGRGENKGPVAGFGSGEIKELVGAFNKMSNDLRSRETALLESESKRKVAEAVEAERRRLFDVFETLPAMICLLTPDYHVVFANRSFRERFGESNDRRCYETCFGRSEPCEFCETFNVLKTGQPHRWEVAGPDGSVIDSYDFPFSDLDGSPMILEMDIDITDRRKSEVELARYRGHLEDQVKERTSRLEAANAQLQVEITERKRMEENLRESEEMVRSQLVEIEAIYRSAPVGMCVFDRNLRYVRINDRLAENNGILPKDHIGKTVRELIPDLADLAENLAERIFRTGNPELNVEFSGTTQSQPGVERYWVENWLPLKDGSGEVTAINVVAEEITDRKRAEEALRYSEERFRTAVESMPDSFAIFSAVRDDTGQIVDFQYQYINEFGARMNYRPAADHIGRTILELLPAHKGTPLFSNYIRITEEGGSLAEESLVYEDIYGGKRLTRAFDIRAAKLGDGFAVIWRDVTERKRAEEALRGYRDALEQRVKERTAELERKNRELQEFAFVASHDLSEPLRKVQTFGSLLKAKGSDHLSELERDYIDRMTGAANRMQELLDALLRYSRVESKGRQFRPVRLDDIAKNAAADLDVIIQRIGAHVDIGMLPTLQGDPYQMKQLFQNLIANSLKYYRSEVKPFVRVYGEENNSDCRIFVEDNGIGFDEKYLEKIFEPFQRLHGRNEYPGTGIGLAICKKIVERHGGKITARSAPGKGSTFIVTLPVSQIQARS